MLMQGYLLLHLTAAFTENHFSETDALTQIVEGSGLANSLGLVSYTAPGANEGNYDVVKEYVPLMLTNHKEYM